MRSIQQTLRKTQKNLSATKSYFKRQIKRGLVGFNKSINLRKFQYPSNFGLLPLN